VLTGLLLATCTALFVSRHWSRTRPALDLTQVYLLIEANRTDEALEVLDALARQKLDPQAMFDWLNLRVVALGMAGRCEEALEVAEGLESLDDGDGATRLVVLGNRAIALLHAGRYAEAEPLLDETEALAEAQREAGQAALADVNVAETWWWRAEIARRRGDGARRRACLERAAGFGAVRYAERARRTLAADRAA
jgi:tetratricopeptide (TPR) repeat protein